MSQTDSQSNNQQDMQSYEIEIKTLLGEKTNRDALIEKIKAKKNIPATEELVFDSFETQINCYFENGDITRLATELKTLLSADEISKLEKIETHGKKISVRAREINKYKVLMVMKASIDDTTSSNGISRIEFEAEMPMTLDILDQLILSTGFTYQAKWSREREIYVVDDITICVDKNAGYGYLAEFEIVTTDAQSVPVVKEKLYALMKELGVAELDQDRLARMFAFYNTHWVEYFGTDKVFIVE